MVFAHGIAWYYIWYGNMVLSKWHYSALSNLPMNVGMAQIATYRYSYQGHVAFVTCLTEAGDFLLNEA